MAEKHTWKPVITIEPVAGVYEIDSVGRIVLHTHYPRLFVFER